MIKLEVNNSVLKEFRNYSSDLTIFYSMYIGVKRAMDLRIGSDIFEDFLMFCKKYNIYIKYDVKFVQISDYSIFKKIVWSENLTTTKTLWYPINSKIKWWIHCFISMNQKYAEELYNYWWYPLIIDDRVIYKSYHDTIEFWYSLWYPDCCIEYFFKKNDWRYYNFPYEIYKNSKIYDYRCNPFWKDAGISYIYNMPCSFWCKKTIKYSQTIIDKLRQDDPWMVTQIEKALLLPILSIREQKIYAFEWTVEDWNSIKYTNTYLLWKKNEWDLTEYFEKWNIVRIEWKNINIYKNSELVHSYSTINSQEIEIPYIIKFEKYDNK